MLQIIPISLALIGIVMSSFEGNAQTSPNSPIVQEQSALPLVWGDAGSPFVRKVLIALEYKNLPYENNQVLPDKVLKIMGLEPNPEFTKVSPLGKIPAYQEGTFSIADSSVIIAYLEKAYPRKALYPQDPKQLAQALWMEEYADTVITDVLHKKVFFELINKPKLNLPTNADVVSQALEKEIPSIFDYLETQLKGPYAGQFLVGDQLSIADISVVTHFIGFQLIAKQTVDRQRYPLLSVYLERVYAIPVVAKIIAQVQ